MRLTPRTSLGQLQSVHVGGSTTTTTTSAIMADRSNEETSFHSRPLMETDEEKSLESKDDLDSMLLKEDGGAEVPVNVGSPKGDNTTNSDEMAPSTSPTRAKSNGGASVTGSNNDGKKPPGKKNLNDATLKAVQTYLLTGDFLKEPLEYEDVDAFALRIHRYTDERTRMRHGALDSTATHRGGRLVDADAAEERLYSQVYEEEEFHAVAADFVKTVAAEASDMAGGSFILHTKTYNWLKRAAGLQRAYDPYGPPTTQPPQHQLFQPVDPQQQHLNQSHDQHSQAGLSDDSDDGEAEASTAMDEGTGEAPRRLTRRRLRMTRKKRRQERLERETEGLRILSEVVQELEKDLKPRKSLKAKGRNSNRDGSSSAPLSMLDTDEDDDMDTSSVPGVIGGRYANSAPPVKRLFPSLETKDLVSLGAPNEFNDPISLSMLDWIERKRQAETPATAQSLQYAPPDAEIPPSLAKLGLEFRPRPVTLDTREFRSTKKGEDALSKFQGSVYASNGKVLLNALHTRARQWAIHEFFYSSLDKDWYQHDGFASDVARLKLPLHSTSKFTRTEWSLVRRKIRRRPRLFSKRFIVDQIRRRNIHRSLVRQLQQDTKLPEFSALAVGASVNAYNKRFKTIRKGTILLHDPGKHEYMVQFDSQKFGCEMCPDFEVAVAGTNVGTPPPSLYEACPSLSHEIERPAELVLAEVSGAPERALEPEELEEIEREILVTLLAVIQKAFNRKKAILNSLDLFAGCAEKLNRDQITWLVGNLMQVNDSIEAVTLHLQVMYGKIYASPESLNDARRIQSNKRELPQAIPHSKCFEEWLDTVTSISSKIGAATEINQASTEKRSKKFHQNVSNSVSMLLLTNYLTESAFMDDKENQSTMSTKALDAGIKTALDRYTKGVLPPRLESMVSEGELENESMLENALKELCDAVGMLRAEVIVAGNEDQIANETLTV